MAVVTAAVWIGLFTVQAALRPSEIGLEMLSVAGILALIIGLPLAGVSWLIGRATGRSGRVRLISFIALHVLVVVAIAGVSLLKWRAHERRVDGSIAESRKQLDEGVARFKPVWSKALRAGVTSLTPQEIDIFVGDGRDVAARSVKSWNRSVMRATAVSLEPISEAAASLRAANEELRQAGDFVREAATTVELDARLATLEEHLRAIARVERAWRDAPEAMRMELGLVASEGDDIASAVALMFPDAGIDVRLTAMRHARECQNHLVLAVQLLRDHWGRWSIATESGATVVLFDSDAKVEEEQYQVLIRRAAAATREFEATMERAAAGDQPPGGADGAK